MSYDVMYVSMVLCILRSSLQLVVHEGTSYTPLRVGEHVVRHVLRWVVGAMLQLVMHS